MRPGARLFVLLVVCLQGAACGGRAYVYDGAASTSIRDRAEIQNDGPIRVSASVPDRAETEAVFGVDLYRQGIQPVWLEIENNGPKPVRFAPVSVDRNYFAPLEIAYKNRKGISDEGQAEMARRFDSLSMPRYVNVGETRSGFVLTHADTGAKGFNVDVFGFGESFHFTYLLRVPGFVPDYANVDFESIYTEDQFERHDDLYGAIDALPCCSTYEDGATTRGAVNNVLVAKDREILRALLRSGWIETSEDEAADQNPHFLFGRKQDAIFRYESIGDGGFYELRLWLAPLLAGDENVWAGQVRHFYRLGAIHRLDPDMDHARHFLVQNLAYGQAVEKIGWVAGEKITAPETFWSQFTRPPYFSDGYTVGIWLSGMPRSFLEAESIDWDTPWIRDP